MSDRKKIAFFGIVFFASLCGAVTFCYLLFKWSEVSAIIRRIFQMLTPIIYGFVIAYLLIPLMEKCEKALDFLVFTRIGKQIKREIPRKVIRNIAIVVTLLIAYGCISAFFNLLVPNLIVSIKTIAAHLPDYIDQLNVYWQNFIKENSEAYNNLNSIFKNFGGDLTISTGYIKTITDSLSSIPSKVSSFAKGVGNLIVGLIISMYVMADKERFLARFKKLIYAFSKRESANIFFTNLNFIHNVFIGFLMGKIIDSLIVGIICYGLVILLKLPYPELISVVVGVTNVIPYFGPFLGAIPCALLVLMTDPVKCVYFVIMIIILQQFDGNVLGPKILGDSTGLSGFWVIFSIMIFGNLMGVLGMFVGVPVFAVIYAIIRSLLSHHLTEKGLPDDTESYVDISGISPQGEMLQQEKVKSDHKKKGWTLNKERLKKTQ